MQNKTICSKPVVLLLLSYYFINNIIKTTGAFSILPKRRRAPLAISEELGKSPTFNYKFFDPLQLANEDNFAIHREAELKHGRIAMLATLGNLVPELYRAEPSPVSSWLLSPSNDLTFDEVPCGLKALSVIPFFGWVQLVAFVGVLETQIFIQNDRRDMPGDYGTGYFGVRNKGRNERALLAELENGRLAMVAFLGQVVAELWTGQNTVDTLRYLLPWNEFKYGLDYL